MSKRKYKIILLILVVLLTIFGVSYAFYEYVGIGENHQLIVGNIYLKLNDGTSSLSLENVFPETKEEARARNDNQISFTISGLNTTTDNDIYYEILLSEGDEETGLTRLKPEHLVFDLVEVNADGTETLVVDAVKIADFNNHRLLVNTINRETTTEIKKTYKLRMWISEDVKISDTNPEADYSTSVFENSYASVKVAVYGDFVEKNIPLVVDNEDTYVENNKSYFYATISNYINSIDVGKNANDNMQLVVTSTNPNVLFSYKDSEGTVVEETTSTLDISYLFNKKKDVTVQVFVTTANDANAETQLRFKLVQNGETIQDYYEDFTVFGNNFCLNNGFDKLYDCILASDSLATDVETAKVNIEAKGEPNLNDTAPSYTYVEDIAYDVENVFSQSGYQFYFADSYEFNPATGIFKLVNTDGSDIITNNLSDTYKNYYTCGGTNLGYSNCSTIYRINQTSISNETYVITKGDLITYKVATSLESEVGLYKAEDDYGDSYVFRGDVTNNNVLFGGYYWKIIRTNGDASIRLIYSGETANSTGNAMAINNAIYTYRVQNDQIGDIRGLIVSEPTYVGYMYGKNFKLQTSEATVYTDIQGLTKYFWADGYEFDEETESFKLKKVNLDPVLGTFAEMKDSYGTYPYTCMSTSVDGVCEMLFKVNSLLNETQAIVQYISYSSIDKASTRTNGLSSNAKIQLETWYKTNLDGKKDENDNLITDYIADGTFCNDRSIIDQTYNSGYLLALPTFYSAYTRLSASNIKAKLTCGDDISDKFSSTAGKGNGLLEYPIALITADEIALAGGKNNSKNENYYLKTSGNYWTMTPSLYSNSYAVASVWYVYQNGSLNPGLHVDSSLGIRPVINLSADVLIASGDGSVENPFTLKLS